MRYRILIFGIVFFASILILMEFDKSIQNKILQGSDYVKTFFSDSVNSVTRAYDRHFEQSATIDALSAKMMNYDKLAFENGVLKNEIKKLQGFLNRGIFTNDEVHHAQILSFVSLSQRDNVWLDTDLSQYEHNEKLNDGIFGIVKDNFAFGIAVAHDGRLEGFLNGNKACNYAVYIGDNRAVGIVHGSGGRISVEYIPNWMKINEGDRIFTSGLDGIFFENIPVGVVEKVRENYGYLSVDVKPYATMNELNHVWIIDRATPRSLLNDAPPPIAVTHESN